MVLQSGSETSGHSLTVRQSYNEIAIQSGSETARHSLTVRQSDSETAIQSGSETARHWSAWHCPTVRP